MILASGRSELEEWSEIRATSGKRQQTNNENGERAERLTQTQKKRAGSKR